MVRAKSRTCVSRRECLTIGSVRSIYATFSALTWGSGCGSLSQEPRPGELRSSCEEPSRKRVSCFFATFLASITTSGAGMALCP